MPRLRPLLHCLLPVLSMPLAPAVMADWVCAPGDGAQQPLWACTDQPAWVGHPPGARAADLDWVPREQLPEALRRALPLVCPGAWVAPTLPPTDLAPGQVRASADSARYRLGEQAEFDGDVLVRQDGRLVRADRATLDEGGGQLHLEGGVRVREANLLLVGEQAAVDLESGAASVDAASFVVHDPGVRGNAVTLERDGDGALHVHDGSLTWCPPDDRSWVVESERVDVPAEGIWATAHDAVLRVGGVPVLWSPRFRFPVSDERQSGFLFPAFGYSAEDGTDLAAPYYFNLAPNYDATVVPRWMSERGVMLEGEFRHLQTRGLVQGETLLAAAWLPEDDQYDGSFDRNDFDELFPGEDFEPTDRWLVRLDHDGKLGVLETRVDWTQVSDADYFRDLGSNLGIASQTVLEREAALTWRQGGFYSRLRTQSFQTLDRNRSDAYERVPEFDLRWTRKLPGSTGATFRVDTEVVSFTRDHDEFSGISAATGERVHLEPRLRLPLRWPWAFVTAEVAGKFTRWSLEHMPDGFDEDPSRSLGMASLDAGLYLERDRSGGGLQVLEPRVYLLWQGYEDQSELPRFDSRQLTFSANQLFRENRFSGKDRLGDASQVTLAVTSRWLDRSGSEVFDLTVGRIQYLRDRRVTASGSPGVDERRSGSPLVAEAGWQPLPHLRFSTTSVWDPLERQPEQLSVRLRWHRDSKHLANLTYRLRRDSVEQVDASLYWALNPRWAVIGRWNYDILRTRNLEQLFGVERDSCCWTLRVVHRSFLKNPANVSDLTTDSGVFLQLVLKGLAGLGGDIGTILENSIVGFRE